jgi:ActD protein
MKAVYGLYSSGQSAQQAVNRLRAAGFADRDITVISPQPMEDYEFGHMDKATWMWWLACLGGLIGMSVGFGLTWLTETAWPMDVGGLPTYAWWPNLIIIFELTMLGAIIATVATLVVSALLPSRGRSLYDPEVTDGHILVGVENPADGSLSKIEIALSAPAGARVKTA